MYSYNIKWIIFRHWLENFGPKWLDKTYENNGEKFAKWIDNKPLIQKVIRKWMNKKINYIINKNGDN